jgi:ABC-type phosphate transport system substrate-binding protein
MAAWQAGFQALATGATVEYDPVGSGGGREAFLAGGDTNFAGSDAYLKDEELTASVDRCAGDKGAIDLPHYVSAIAVAYNVPALEGTDIQLSPETLAKIFTNQISNWNTPRPRRQPRRRSARPRTQPGPPLRRLGHDSRTSRTTGKVASTSGPTAHFRTER